MKNDSLKKIFLETHNIKNLRTGFGQFNYNLARALSKETEFLQDHELILNCNNPVVKSEIGTTLSYHRYRPITRYPFFRIKKKFSIWHSVNQNTKIEPASSNIPYVLTIHDVNFLEEETGKKLDFRINQLNNKIKRSSAIVYVSEFAMFNTHTHFNVPNIPEYVIYNGNNFNYQHAKHSELYCSGVVPEKPFIFTIGQVVEKKNFHTLIEMLPFVPEVDLVIAGDLKSEYAVLLQQKIQAYKLEKRVHLLGSITESDKIFYYKNCLAFCFPSLREGFGLPVLEAMTFGKPIFLSNKTSLPEIGGKYSFYWENFEPKYMAEIFLQGLSFYNQNTEMYATAYQNRAQKFTWENAAKEYLNVYKSVLNQ
ncbi:glycosyltransferase family 1 protein [Flavobacterium sp. UMI-01]|uniref:glycosyltransferase family 4 protein n=1 Tax=Flavobacterium sp. UMI-01 TaxID=1441053 RepID=UPI001C7D1209|nr:glycosyltransferase family 1 protein [Flavobacterium sp. UMI-01]GIZ08246.1 glycosyl transferase [Flavobacterium sp. UMI-01]